MKNLINIQNKQAMPKINGKFKKKPYIPDYNRWALKPGQVSRAAVNEVKAAQSKTSAGSFNIRKSQ